MLKSTILCISMLFLCLNSVAQAPNYINYQGRLTDDVGDPVSDGDYNIFFQIYDAETDGSILWSSDRMTVPVTDGLFNVKLGPLTPGIFTSAGDRYLEIRVESDPAISPRTHLVSVPYALNAASSGWTDNGTDVVLTTSSDDVGIGTDTPSAGTKLTVHGSSGGRAAYFQAAGQHSLQSYNNVPNGYAHGYSIWGRTGGGDGSSYGVYGQADGGAHGIGVEGTAHTNIYTSIGVRGRADTESGAANTHIGVYGNAEHGLTENTGVFARAQSNATNNYAVYATATGAGTTNYGIYASAAGAGTDYAGYFSGDVHITGTLTGGKVGIPTGGIIMWSGDSDKIPDGWILCDGSKGTPDLTGQFIMDTDKASTIYKLAYIMKL